MTIARALHDMTRTFPAHLERQASDTASQLDRITAECYEIADLASGGIERAAW